MNAQEWLDEIPEDLTETVLELPPKTIKKLIGLNNSQLRAVLTLEGPVQINAVAGSGKTRVLTSRIAYMLSTGIKARHILCTTYTKKATQEMTERLSKLISSLQLAQITIGTTHSIGYRILAEELDGVGHPLADAFKYNNVIMGTRHKIFAEKIIESMERDRHVPFSIKQEMRDIGLGQYIGAVSWAKNEGISWDQYDSMHGGSSDRQDAYIEFYKRYEKKKVEECVIDGDDMLYLLWWLFKQHPDVLARYQKKFKYLLVDEAQDNNGLQYEIIKMLGKPENNLFLVGDDDQSMYSFRGAKPEEFIDFTKTYKGAQQISMEDNYRSNPHILEVANNLIKNNQKRLPKKLVANKQNDEPCVSFEVHESEIEEAKKVVEEIKLQVEQGGKNPKDITILYRTNAQSRALEDYLIISGIPYVIHGGTSFYERKEIKDLICYLRLVADSNDDEAFKRVINTPSRYLGKAFMEKVKRFDGSHWEAITEPSMSWKNYEQKGIDEFVDLVEELRSVAEHGAGDFGEGSPTEVIDYLLDNCYKKHMSNELTSDDFSSRMENVETLKFVMEQHDSIGSFLKHISDLMSQAKHDIDGVQLMTIHKSKGLEFDTAFVVGVSEGCLPHFRAIESYNDGRKQAIEEERRLLYVAITRAESVCHISAPKTFLGKPAPVSRFSKELGIEISDMSGTDVDLEDTDVDTSDLAENLLKWGGN
ncbi:ATP-dependent DNA helicase [Bacillus phage vB_BsuM-Goe9]|nr:ATP-dependent DNA helicase [Bacillus phage vB_BsuM-Goe9]